MGEVMHVWGQEVYEKSLYLPINFAVNLKLLYKNSLNKKFFKVNLILNERTLSKESAYYMIPFTQNSTISKTNLWFL